MSFVIVKGRDGVGFDFGRVVTEFLLGRKASEIGDSFLDVPPYTGAFEGVAALVDAATPSLTCVVSYVSELGGVVETMTRRWLQYHNFYKETGFRPDKIGFTTNWRDKASLLMQLTDGKAKSFTDDKLMVLERMRPTVPHLFLYGQQPAEQVTPGGIEHVADWTAVLAKHGLRV